VKPFKIEKIEIQAKSRVLKATWTSEVVDNLVADHAIDLEKEIAKILQAEIDKEILIELCKTQGWIEVKIDIKVSVDKDWCAQHIKKKYKNLNNFWYFEDSRDAEFFILRWSS
jgi:hypothetical protein